MNSIVKIHTPLTLSRSAALALAEETDLNSLMQAAAQLRDEAHGARMSYSRKIFIPLTHLCRNVCHYCTFAQTPKKIEQPFMLPEEILKVAHEGVAAGCHEVLFTLGDKPELRYETARIALADMGYASTFDYLFAMSKLVFEETGLLPHLNPGVMSEAELLASREVSVSQGMMLESVSERLCEKGMPHYGSPDKLPSVRLETLRLAGKLRIPYTSGILIGIGETRLERVESLLALRDLHQQYGHIQEIIIQNFCAKKGTKMANVPDAPLEELLWTIAVARLIFGGEMNLQTPPNLNQSVLAQLIDAGINDWGGVSPLTPDFVNPEKPWPALENLARHTAASDKLLIERLPVYPAFALDTQKWQAETLRASLLKNMDSEGYARREHWTPGSEHQPPQNIASEGYAFAPPTATASSFGIQALIAKAERRERLTEKEIVQLFQARGSDYQAVCEAANSLRQAVNGDTVT